MAVLVPEPVEIYAAESVADVQAAVTNAGRLLVRGGGSKTALSRPQPGAAVLELARLAGILEYNPGEFVFTALAGTPLATIEAELAQHGQYLPFNPPLAGRGATLGGTVAAGLSGAGRQRYGGLRDFFIGARFVDGQGRLVRSGGKVVKNAAGFDQHKLLIGSLGRLGVLVELSFKVFPQPPAYGTLRVDVADAAAGVAVLRRLATTRFDLEALDLRVNDPTLFPAAGANGTAGCRGPRATGRAGGRAAPTLADAGGLAGRRRGGCRGRGRILASGRFVCLAAGRRRHEQVVEQLVAGQDTRNARPPGGLGRDVGGAWRRAQVQQRRQPGVDRLAP